LVLLHSSVLKALQKGLDLQESYHRLRIRKLGTRLRLVIGVGAPSPLAQGIYSGMALNSVIYSLLT
jgi:hypothetical protein